MPLGFGQSSADLVLITQQSAGPSLANSVAQTSLLNGQGRIYLRENSLFIGQALRLKASGIISTAAAPGTLTLMLMLNDVAVLVAVAALAVSAVSVPWSLRADLSPRSVGGPSAATLAVFGQIASVAFAPVMQFFGAASGVGFDSTQPVGPVDFQGQWSVANASNSITCEQYEIVSNNP